MFARLFAAGGLSLDRLRSLLEVAAAGSIAKAAAGDPVKQSQYSRQIKELESFFAVKLIERHGRGIRLTANGQELARIGRFFLLGLSNFQRGCRGEEQTFAIGAGATFIERFLLPVLAEQAGPTNFRCAVETVGDDEVERRLHELTLDFGIVAARAFSRPLQSQKLGVWRLNLWVPRAWHKSEREARRAFAENRLPLVLAAREPDAFALAAAQDAEARLTCDNFLQASIASQSGELAALLPDFMTPGGRSAEWRCLPNIGSESHAYHLAWNPRLLRLNPRAARVRDFLAAKLTGRLQESRRI